MRRGSHTDDNAQWPREETFILITGGLGYIGSHTALLLLQEGFNVIIVDNRGDHKPILTNIKRLAEIYCKSVGRNIPKIHFHNVSYFGDDMASLMRIYYGTSVRPGRSHITAVVHFAAHKVLAESIRDPLPYYANNLSGLIDLLRLLKSNNIKRFVISSSAAVYGAAGNFEHPLDEEMVAHRKESHKTSATSLTSPYARTKYFAEAILADMAHSDSSWNITAFRYFNPVGCHSSGLLAEDPQNRSSSLFAMISHVINGDHNYLEVFGSDWKTRDGTAMRDFVHVLDVARGHVDAIKKCHGAGFRVYNLGSGRGTTVLEVISTVESFLGRPIPLKMVSERPGDVAVCVAATWRAQRELGWQPMKTLDTCVEDMLKSTRRIGKQL